MLPHSLQKPFLLLLLICLTALTACCQKPPRPPPPPISLDEQATRLSLWSHQIPYLNAKTVPLGVRLNYLDANGNAHSDNAEGRLVFLQPFANVAAPPQKGNIYLEGRVVDQLVFDAGRNDAVWWFAIHMGDKTAWQGDATRPVDLAALNRPQSHTMLRADLVLDLLALSDLPSYAAPLTARGQFLVMRVNDADATNDLFVEQVGESGRPFIARQLIVDRFTGEVREVRLYDPAGILVVRSFLSDYVPVKYPEGAEKPADPPKFPRKVAVSYPAQHLAVALEFDANDLMLKAPRPAAFATPNWEEEHIHPIPVD